MKDKLGLILGILVIVGLFIVGFSDRYVGADVAAFTPATCYSAAATTTLVYQTAGTATTTVSCNMSPDGARSATLAAIINASSTGTIYNFYVEESMDGVDWFPVTLGQTASTTGIFTPYQEYQRNVIKYTFASSTVGAIPEATGLKGVNTTNNRNHITAEIPVRMKQVRVHAALAASSVQGAIWFQILPRQEF